MPSTKTLKQRALDLYRQGHSWDSIASTLDVDTSAAERLVNDPKTINPLNPTQGIATVANGQTTVTVSGLNLPDANYAVNLGPTWNTSAWVTSRTATSFVINVGTAPGSNSPIAWRVIRGD